MPSKIDEFLNRISDQNVLIWGLGLNGGGLGATKFFAEHAKNVRVTDLKSEEELTPTIAELESYPDITFTLGEHRQTDFDWADLVIRNPAVPDGVKWLKYCKQQDIEVQMEAALFVALTKAHTIGITGTRGKSTTTELITSILAAAGKSVFSGGNNRTPLLNNLLKLTRDDYIVMELSSFQLSGLKNLRASPELSVVTNMYPDHLNWHGDMQSYIEAKKNIIRYQTPANKQMLNLTNKVVSENFTGASSAQLIGFGTAPLHILKHKSNLSERLQEDLTYVEIKGDTILINSEQILTESELKIQGRHNLENIAAAIATSLAVGIDLDISTTAVRDFTGLPYRQELVGEINNVKVINDSTSTMPEALIAALTRFGKEKRQAKLHLIAGGMNKDVSLAKLPQILAANVDSLHLLAGTFHDQLTEIYDQDYAGPFSGLELALQSALEISEPRDIILFSPAATSFNMFDHEWDRAEQFNLLVKKYQGQESD